MSNLAGKSAMMTAAASGIGRATALTMAARGAPVMIADINMEAGNEVAPAVRAAGFAKGAVNTLTEYLATSFGRDNIRCNAVAPSMTRTPIRETIVPEPLSKANEDSLLLPYSGTPDDIANIVAFLASDDTRNITGHIIRADGGAPSHLAIYADAPRFYDAGANQ